MRPRAQNKNFLLYHEEDEEDEEMPTKKKYNARFPPVRWDLSETN